MANATSLVPTTAVPFGEDCFYWPLVTSETVTGTYWPGALIGLRSDGYAGKFDDSADMTFLGIVADTVPLVVSTGDGIKLIKLRRPYRFGLAKNTSTFTRATDIGKPVYASDDWHGSLSPGTYANLIGYLVDVEGTNMPGALTGAIGVIQPPTAPTLSGNNMTTGAGAGITSGTGTIYKNSVELAGGIIKTTIYVDLTGLASSTTDLDIIGVGTDPAHLGRILAAQQGTIEAIRMTCLELPAGGADDIDLYAATEGTGVFDGGIAALTETALITSGGAWASGTVKAATAVPAANQYLYLTGGEAGTAATYTAGKFLIEIIGY